MKYIQTYHLFEEHRGEELGLKIKSSKEELTPQRLALELRSLMQNEEFLNWAGKIALDNPKYRPQKDELIDGYCELVCGYILFKWPKYKAKKCGDPGIVVDRLKFRKGELRPHSILRWNLGPGNNDPGWRVRSNTRNFAYANALYFDAATPEGVDHWSKLKSIPSNFFQQEHWYNLVYYDSCVKLPKQVTREAGLNPPIPITLKRLGLL